MNNQPQGLKLNSYLFNQKQGPLPEEIEARLVELIKDDPVFREEMQVLAQADSLKLDWFSAWIAAEVAGKAIEGWSEKKWLDMVETNSTLQRILGKEQIKTEATRQLINQTMVKLKLVNLWPWDCEKSIGDLNQN